MDSKKEKFEFKAEITQLMNLIINSLYSNKEIFLRELISNASDALDKIRFESIQNPEILKEDSDLKIRISVDEKEQTLEVSDNGIGMTYDELIKNIGTVAQSGTSEFIAALEKSKDKMQVAPELIGKFGVGFYSSFIVAKEVSIFTKSYKSDKAYKWTSDGLGAYTIEETDKKLRGTQIILKLKDKEEDGEDFLNEWTIKGIIKKHSDFVSYPIVMNVETDEAIPEKEQIKDKTGKTIGATTRKVKKDETLNSMQAIWAKNKADITEKEYEEFYQHISHNWDKPLETIHIKLEGKIEYNALLFVPSKAPFDLFHQDRKNGMQLYCKRIFIMDNCKELIPDYLGFIYGIVDCPDLDLNVSREILQQSSVLKLIKKNLVSKILSTLSEMDKEKFDTFYSEFGQVLKSGIVTDYENKEKISNLIKYKTIKSQDKLLSLKEIIANMPAEQQEIYYLTGENFHALLNSPRLEFLKEKGFEVLLMTDPIDEWVVQHLTEFEGKKLKSVEKSDIKVDDNKEKKEKEKTFNNLLNYIKEELKDKVKDVKVSEKLTQSISCLSGEEYNMSAYMEKIMKAAGQKTPEQKRILELNINHPLFESLKNIFEKDIKNPILKTYCNLFYDLALVAEGEKLQDGASFSQTITKIMLDRIKD